MKTTICIALLIAFSTATAEARRSRPQHLSYKFYRNFYEAHKNAKPSSPRPFGPSERVPYWDCDAVAVNVFAGRRIINWVCLNGEEQ